MRRLVADLLLLARADAGREPPRRARRPGRRRGRGRLRARAGGGRPRDLDLGRAGRRDRGRAGRAAPARAEPDGERAAPHRPGHGGRGQRSSAPTATSCWRSRTTGRASRRSCRKRSSSASSARTAIAPAPPGSGLAIVRAVAESHHGTVKLEPPLDGRGARFVVRFPRGRLRTSQGLKPRAQRPMLRRTCLTSPPSSSWCSRSAARNTRCRSVPFTRSSVTPSPAQ